MPQQSGYATANFPNGITSWGIPVFGSSALPLPASGGNYWFVSSVSGNNGNPGTFASPFATLAYAAAYASVQAGDVIVVLEGHAENIAAAAGVTLSTNGLTVYGMGSGAQRPTFTFTTATTASMLISGSGVTVSGIVGVAGINNLVNPINVTGSSPAITMDWQDASGKEAISCMYLNTVAYPTVNLTYRGIAGSAVCLNPIKLNACTNANFNLNFYGSAGTAVVNSITGASSGTRVTGYIYNSGTSTGAKNYVDTIGGSTWYINVFDGVAGAPYSGSSSVTPVLGSSATDINALFGASGIATWPTPSPYGNGVSMAATLAYLQNIATREVTCPASSTSINTASAVTAFTVAGGPVVLEQLYGLVTTAIGATATTLKFSNNPTGSTATDLCTATAITSAAVNALLTITGTVANALTVTAPSAAPPAAMATPLVIAPGVITFTTSATPGSGAIQFGLRYRPLNAACTVTPAALT